jgi:flagellar biosynthesis anti-sigma factor FlgM
MNIDKIQSQLIRLYGGRAQGPRGSEQTGASGAANTEDAGVRKAGDELTLSSEASSARRLASVVASAPDVRDQLVEELRTQVRAGTYQPNDEAVAQALLRGE